MWIRVILIAFVLAVAAGSVAWLNRTAIILYVVSNAGKFDVAANRPVEWLQGPTQPASPPSERPPNIVFILADDLGMNDVSTFGGGVAGGAVPTPHIDRLAAEGATFTNAYAGTGTCAPSRAMLLTGRYPTRTGFEFTPTPDGMGRMLKLVGGALHTDTGMPPLVVNETAAGSGPGFADKGLPPEEVTIAEVLKPRGYHSVHIGKWHLGRSERFRAVSQGFDESLLMASGLYLPENDPNGVDAKLPFDPIDIFLWARMQFAADYDRVGEPLADETFAPASYITDYYTDEALKVIEANRHRPFFLYLAHWGPHTPLQATRADYEAVGDIEPHRHRVYAAMIRAVDRSVGRVLAKLEEEGLAENTLVVFSSDNGGAGYIGLPEVNAPFRGWKISLFEGGIRVPTFVRWPARIPANTVIDTPVAHIDVMPTLAAAAGAPLPRDVAIDGRNLLPLASGEATALERPDDAIFWSSGFNRVVRAGNWKLHHNGRQARYWLFDLARDPTEQNNLADRRPDKVAELTELMAAHWADAREPLYPHVIESAICIDRTLVDLPCEGGEYAVWPN